MALDDAQALKEQIKQSAKESGFALCGVAPAARPETFDFLQSWLREGHHAGMEYIPRREQAYAHPEAVLQSVRSVIMLAATYDGTKPTPKDAPSVGAIAAYACGAADYHDVLRERMRGLTDLLHQASPSCRTRTVVDTAPLLERDFARTAGLGWFGKNTMLINKHIGSNFFLCAILTDLALPPDSPHEASHCGTCTKCLEACPTDAFLDGGGLDARRCISYWTIEELNKLAPTELREDFGEWMFGCDICQDVCPWNRHVSEAEILEFQSSETPSAEWFLFATEAEFVTRFKGTPLERTGRDAMSRNAAITIGNSGDVGGVSVLVEALRDQSHQVRTAVAWAIGMVASGANDPSLMQHLRRALDSESEQSVRTVLADAISKIEAR